MNNNEDNDDNNNNDNNHSEFEINEVLPIVRSILYVHIKWDEFCLNFGDQ